MEIMFLLLGLAMSKCSPLYPYTMFFMFRNWLTALSLYIGLYKIGIVRTYNEEDGNNTNKKDLPSSQQATSKTWAASQIWLYHKRLGHPPFGLLKIMFPYLFTKESVESFKCDVCQFLKHYRATFSSILNLLTLFILICKGKLVTLYRGLSGLYRLLMIIFLMKHKSEICQIFVDFFCLVKNQFDKSIKRLHSNNGTEFVNLEFSKFLKDNGVVHELTCVNTPQQNRIAKRKNRHLLEVARALSFQMSIPNVYWGEAILTTTYLINRLPTHILNDISPIKHMLSFFPNTPLMLSLPSRVFGCFAFVHSRNPLRGKLDPRVVKCVFIGYPSNKNKFNPPLQGDNYLEVEPVIESLPSPTQDVIKSLPFPTQDVQVQVQEVTKPTLTPKQGQLFEPKVSIPEPIEDVINDMSSFEERKMCQSFIVSVDAIKTPTSTQEALKDENWTQAMKEEIKTLEKNSTWKIIDKPKDKRVVGYRWIYIVKCKSNGTLERYKARLVAKGYT
ncbi:hypothetical protein CR513_12680, partial [Mucuna pruriens]